MDGWILFEVWLVLLLLLVELSRRLAGSRLVISATAESGLFVVRGVRGVRGVLAPVFLRLLSVRNKLVLKLWL